MNLTSLLLSISIASLAQTPVTQEDRQKANSFYIAGDWANAITAYKKIADAEPQNFNARTRLGASLTQSGMAKEAIQPLEDAVKLGNNNQSMYYLASAYAANHQPELAFQWLEKAATNGFALPSVLDNDKGFAALKADPRYAGAREGILRNVYPCRQAAKSREFDFWLGEWDVKNVLGQPAGKSKIELMLGDCVILENWTAAPPFLYDGKSINLYNPATQKWMQTWVDDKGGLLEFINGEYKDNKMVFVTLPDPKNQVTRLTFYNLSPDLVRQQFETTTDNGKTWKTTTDLNYHRVANSGR
jgi:tetratricopeptide (TPR) repeat protein